MKFFETFNFDIIIVLVLIVSILTGLYHSFFKQFGISLSLVIPSVILYFSFKFLLEYFYKITNGGFFKNSESSGIINSVGLYLLLFLILMLIVRLIYLLFRPSREQRILKSPKLVSRIGGGLLGIINAYFILSLLLYLVYPVVNINNDNILTKLMNRSANEVISITKLNKVQNVNVDSSQSYLGTEEVFTGRFKFDKLKEIEADLLIQAEIEFYLKNELYLYLNQNSKDLIDNNLEENNYITTVLKVIDGKTIFEKIIEQEIVNSNLVGLEEKYTELKSLKYLFLFKYFENFTYSITDIEEVILTNQDEIYESINSNTRKLEFERIVAGIKAVNEMDRILNFNLENEDLEARVFRLEDLLNDDTKIKELNIKIEVVKSDNIYVNNFENLLQEYLKNLFIIEKIDKNISFSKRIVLAKNYNLFFEDGWLNSPLIREYLIDSITSINVSGYELYHEFFFYNYLADDLGPNASLDDEYFGKILSRVDNLVKDDILTEKEKNLFLKNLFEENSSVIKRLIASGRLKLSKDLIDGLTNNN